jgi:Plasmid pRiA4b ORF-3-like protein
MSQATSPATPTDKRNYILEVALKHLRNPRITRTLSVPPTATFHELHGAIQIAFEWNNAHLYHFEILDMPAPNAPKAPKRSRHPKTLLNVSLENYFDDGTPHANPKTTKLCEVLEQRRYQNKYIEYIYDYGANWELYVAVIGHAEEATPDGATTCLTGEGAPMEEDVCEEDDEMDDERSFDFDLEGVNKRLANFSKKMKA